MRFNEEREVGRKIGAKGVLDGTLDYVGMSRHVFVFDPTIKNTVHAIDGARYKTRRRINSKVNKDTAAERYGFHVG